MKNSRCVVFAENEITKTRFPGVGNNNIDNKVVVERVWNKVVEWTLWRKLCQTVLVAISESDSVMQSVLIFDKLVLTIKHEI